MSLFKKEESYLGIDIGAGGMKLVELKKTKGRAQLWTYGILDKPLDIHPVAGASLQKDKTPEDLLHREIEPKKKKKKNESAPRIDDPRVDLFAGYLKELMKKTKASGRKVTASLPVSHVFHAGITLPIVDEKEITHHINAKVKKMLPRPIEDMQVVHQQVYDPKNQEEGYDKKYMKFLVTAAPKDLVSFYTAVFEKAGLQLEELETEAFALERSLVGHDMATIMIVDMGAERTNFFIIDGGLPVTHRSIRLGGKTFDRILMDRLQVDEQSVTQIKYDISRMKKEQIKEELFIPAIDPIIKEIKYSFDLYAHQTGNEHKKLEKIVLTGGGALFPPVATYIQKRFNMRAFIGDPWARVVYQQGLKHLLDQNGPRMAVSIGLAMRNII
ncbi:MAG: pilus assembly protein PilM [Candidatus Magasanikbacteria bacterium]|jgi:type IV pilus assembly protein PilM|nr:pilus assembly protein PilM [Candidatus Magasanikbacteria bacterium]MBT4221253.1 pilus assembly protein PilM [Candidatus Magasanikbacteria bacterium]MBT4350399.1 pilus assembly protein PilM [Candidatus Magasanikbacteria bacterium]MBT4542054.1 pilus assembly protein PilM [Candidatus Magasanikbacteria bacterium]MBT6253586.1 pilus assembly protein PilM [Candidatus Magasanikbacteria bacterium]